MNRRKPRWSMRITVVALTLVAIAGMVPKVDAPTSFSATQPGQVSWIAVAFPVGQAGFAHEKIDGAIERQRR